MGYTELPRFFDKKRGVPITDYDEFSSWVKRIDLRQSLNCVFHTLNRPDICHHADNKIARLDKLSPISRNTLRTIQVFVSVIDHMNFTGRNFFDFTRNLLYRSAVRHSSREEKTVQLKQPCVGWRIPVAHVTTRYKDLESFQAKNRRPNYRRIIEENMGNRISKRTKLSSRLPKRNPCFQGRKTMMTKDGNGTKKCVIQ